MNNLTTEETTEIFEYCVLSEDKETIDLALKKYEQLKVFLSQNGGVV